jgi:hypothetical protein
MLRDARKPRFHRRFCVLRKHSQKFPERENTCTPRRASMCRSPIDIAESGGAYTQN